MIKIWVLISMYSMNDIHKVNTKSLGRVCLFTRVTVSCNLYSGRLHLLGLKRGISCETYEWMNWKQIFGSCLFMHCQKCQYMGFMLQIHHRINTTLEGFLIAGEMVPLVIWSTLLQLKIHEFLNHYFMFKWRTATWISYGYVSKYINMNDLNVNYKLHTDYLFCFHLWLGKMDKSSASPWIIFTQKKELYTLLLLLLLLIVVVVVVAVAVVKNVQIKQYIYSPPTGPEGSRILRLSYFKYLTLHNLNSW